MSVAKKIDSLSAQNLINVKLKSEVKIQDLTLEQPNGQAWKKTIGVVEKMDSYQVLEWLMGSELRQICQKSNPFFHVDVNCSARMLAEEEEFLARPLTMILDPEEILGKKEAEFILFSQEFSCLNAKKEAVVQLLNTLRGLQFKTSTMESAQIIVDELASNAIFNAPFVNLDDGTNPGIDRKLENIKMPEGHKAELFVGMDQQRLIIGCRDSFGTLRLKDAFKKLHKCYLGGLQKEMNMGRGGAGIGSFMVFEQCVGYYAAVVHGQQTLICCAIPYNVASKTRDSYAKNIHYFEKIN